MEEAEPQLWFLRCLAEILELNRKQGDLVHPAFLFFIYSDNFTEENNILIAHVLKTMVLGKIIC